ncbi:MAG: glycosyltransferase family 87 protein, partial [Candidatus Binatia bacterium]
MTSAPPPPPALRLAAAAESLATRPKVAAAIAIALAVYGAVICSRKMGDYDVYHRAAERLLDGERIYRLEDPHRYLYAPLFPFLFVPLAPLPAFAGKVVWYLVNLALAVSAIRLATQLVFPEGRAPPGFTLLLVLLSLRFLDNNVAHGQMNLLMLWLI